MARDTGKGSRPGGGPGKRDGSRPGEDASDAGGSRVAGTLALPANLGRSLRHLDDGDLDRLLEAVAAEARRRGRPDGKTSGGRARGKPAPVTAGQEKLILAGSEAGLKPVAIAREFRLSRAQVEGVVAGARQRRR
ncbi:MAG: hypothetical protein OXC28_16105 [Defluviicoccus sp.]|nr:hypothetical protein [Defluviicoccus sp.]